MRRAMPTAECGGNCVKGTVYSGIAYMPQHPDADMHGLIRIVIRTRSWLAVRDKLDGLGISDRCASNIWTESRSHVEQLATEGRYGEPLACPIVLAYLKPENYKPIPRSLLRIKA